MQLSPILPSSHHHNQGFHWNCQLFLGPIFGPYLEFAWQNLAGHWQNINSDWTQIQALAAFPEYFDSTCYNFIAAPGHNALCCAAWGNNQAWQGKKRGISPQKTWREQCGCRCKSGLGRVNRDRGHAWMGAGPGRARGRGRYVFLHKTCGTWVECRFGAVCRGKYRLLSLNFFREVPNFSFNIQDFD